MNNDKTKNKNKKIYSKPAFEEIIIDNEISLIMQSPGGNPDPGSSSSSSSGGNDW